MERSDFLGAEYIDDTAAHAGKFGAITALAATVVSGDTVALDYSGNSIASMPIPAGTTIYGIFTSVKLTSGKVVAYKI
jgi:hypothetical protein